jgi:putative DNA primase/helicase
MSVTAKPPGGKDGSNPNGKLPRPKPLPVRIDGIPDQLKAMDRWVVWHYVEDRDPETGEEDWDKPPLNAGGGAGSSTNPRTWSPFAKALVAYQEGGLDGLGFVLAAKKGEEGAVLIGVDLDHCRDPNTGAVTQWAQEIIDALHSYTEVSPSGEGIRIFLFGRLPAQGRKRGNFECYCTGRYVTVTGQHLDGTPRTIGEREAQLLAVHKEIWPAHHVPKQALALEPRATDLTDLDLIERAKKARNGSGPKFSALWSGDRGGYGSPSEADLALCNYLAFWCGANARERIDDLFRQSGLFRGKWNREDYRKRTIEKALHGRTEFYAPKSTWKAKGQQSGNGKTPKTPNTAMDAEPPPEAHLTDLGNAQRVVARHGQDLRYCHAWKCFLTWDGQRWAADDTGEAERRAKETQRSFYRWAADRLAALAQSTAGDEEARKQQATQLTRVVQHALKWEEARRMSACLELARSEPGIPIRPAGMDRDPWALNLANGTIDLRTGRLRPHQREDLLTKLAPVAYDPAATCPLWEGCLKTWMGGNRDLVDYLRRTIGYALSADVSEQVLFFLYGTGCNGKSTFLNTIREVLGDYACQAVSELLLAKNTEAHPTERADLFGRRFVTTIEADEGKRMAEALMKQLTGGDPLKARKMRQNFFEMTPTWKIFLAANHQPVIRGTDFAVWRRIRLIPFTVTINDAAKDKHLDEKLRGEQAGILNWAVRGCLEWQHHGLADPEEVRQATEAYQREQDSLANFIADCCVVAEFAKIKSSLLLKAYQEWSGDKNITPPGFRARMNAKGFYSKESSGSYFYHGIGLAASDNEWQGR